MQESGGIITFKYFKVQPPKTLAIEKVLLRHLFCQNHGFNEVEVSILRAEKESSDAQYL